ncbi:MAG: hypothetical protein ACP5N1_01095 [Candidatus Woesearchaeota archaeon]
MNNIKNTLSSIVLGLNMSLTSCVKVTAYYNAPQANGYDVAIYEYDNYIRINITDLDGKGPADGSLNYTFIKNDTLIFYDIEGYNIRKDSNLEKMNIDDVKSIYTKSRHD